MLRSYLHKDIIGAGCDEAGRGCLAGPVFAAAVILPKSGIIEGLDDSKKLSEKKRLELRQIIESSAVAYAVARVDQKVIDQINILQASILAMQKAVEKLSVEPEHLLIDGNRFHQYRNIPHSCIIKGDAIYAAIAAASVLAKTYRDEYMEKLHPEFPEYNWKQNKGYPTKQHKEAIMTHGLTPYHRLSFKINR